MRAPKAPEPKASQGKDVPLWVTKNFYSDYIERYISGKDKPIHTMYFGRGIGKTAWVRNLLTGLIIVDDLDE